MQRQRQLRVTAQVFLHKYGGDQDQAFQAWQALVEPDVLRQPRKFFRRWAGRSTADDTPRSGRPPLINRKLARELARELKRGAPDHGGARTGCKGVAAARKRSAAFRYLLDSLPHHVCDRTILRAAQRADPDLGSVTGLCKPLFSPRERLRRMQAARKLLRLPRTVLQQVFWLDEASWGPKAMQARVLGSKAAGEWLHEDARAPKSHTDITPLHFSVTVNYNDGAVMLAWLRGPRAKGSKGTYLVRGALGVGRQRRRRLAQALQQVGRAVGGCVHDEHLLWVAHAFGNGIR